MRAALLVVSLISLLVITECADKAELFAGAHKCCVGCSSVQRRHLESEVADYNARNGADAELAEYLQKSYSGEACRASKTVKKADYVTVSCPPTQYDVAMGPQTVNCSVTYSLSAGIYYLGIYASVDSVSISPTDSYYYDVNATATWISKIYSFKLPQYAPYGNWTVIGYAYGPNYSPYIQGSAQFVVKQTRNDVYAPTLHSLSLPVINANDIDQQYISILLGSFYATDDIAGVRSVYLYFDALSSAYAYWYAPYDGYTNTYLAPIVISGSLNVYFSAIPAVGVYTFYVYIQDNLGRYSYISSADLKSRGLQYNVTIGSSSCTAGYYRPYGSTAACQACVKGTYSTAGAFRCKACAPGYYPSVSSAAKSCAACPAGKTSLGGDKGCTTCPAGTYSYSAGSAICSPCYPGSNSSAGATSCSSCPPGTYSAGGVASCTKCPAGSFAGGYAAICQKCPAGTYGPTAGLSSCLPCAAGTYGPWIGYTYCKDCPVGQTGPAGSHSGLSCYAP